MKNICSVLLLSLGLLVWQAGCNDKPSTSTPEQSQSKTNQTVKKTYCCPKHHEITSDKPGKCSKCGMDLVDASAKCTRNMKMKQSAKCYSCPMHPEVTSDKPGKCSKCGMPLVKQSAKCYSCPMHPEVTSDKPGKCSKCGMDLVKKTQ